MSSNDFFYNKEGEPVFLTGLQCHNSSSGTEMIDWTIDAIKMHSGNLLEAPVYWCEVEKTENTYELEMVKELIDKAAAADLYLIPLWFGASKNGLFTYAPDYVKRNPGTYQMARNAAGIPVESLSPHCRETLERDKKAFVKVLEFIAEYDTNGTVIAVQVENEMGLVHTDRDYSRQAQREYEQPVPEILRDIRIADSGVSGEYERPTWKQIFGRHGNEAFSAWKHACYAQELAAAGKEKLAVPCIMNVSIEINEYEEPGKCYIAGGPVSRVLDIWKAVASDITLFGPDIYLPSERDFRKACEAYARPDNPLFIPESCQGGVGPAMNLLIAAAEYDAIGICAFGAESGISGGRLLPDAQEVALSMGIISAMAPLLIKYRGTGRIHAMTQAEFSSWQYVKAEQYHIVGHFISADQKIQHYYGSRINLNDPENQEQLSRRGRCLLADCGDGEFYVAGAGICLTFTRRPEIQDEISYTHLTSTLSSQLHFLSIEEGHFEDGRWICEYRRNGDEANYQLYLHKGQMVRIQLNTELPWLQDAAE